MSTVVALGETLRLQGFALAGVDVVAAASDDEVRAAWRSLDDDVGLVILTTTAGRVLADEVTSRPDVLTVVMPS